MKSFVVILLLVVCCSGCATITTIHVARGETDAPAPEDEKHVAKPQPAAYAFIPVAVVADIVTIPYWTGVTIAVNLGLMRPPF